VAASVGGSPDAVLSWDSTPYALELHVNAVRGLSVCIDETQRAKVEAVQKTVYDLTTDTGKMRGAQSGGVRATSRYESLVLSTGEQSISDFGEAGGARARVLTMWGPPWSRGSAAQRVSDATAAFQRDVIDTLTDNHGHAGRIFAGYVAGLTTEERRDLRARYRTLCNAASAEVEATSPGHPIGSRLAEYVAFGHGMSNLIAFHNMRLFNDFHSVNTTSIFLLDLHDLSKASLANHFEQIKVSDFQALSFLKLKIFNLVSFNLFKSTIDSN
jgi:hypothetical protein